MSDDRRARRVVRPLAFPRPRPFDDASARCSADSWLARRRHSDELPTVKAVANGRWIMSPDGTGTVVALWILAGLVFLGAVAAGARLGRAGVAMFMARAGVTLAAGMALVLAIAGSLNAQNAWYGSWQDLWGSITGAPLAQAAAQH